MLGELKHAEEHYKKINCDVMRLSDELRQEEQHHEYVEKLRQGYDREIKVKLIKNVFFFNFL